MPPSPCQELDSDTSSDAGDALLEVKLLLDNLEHSMMRRLAALDDKLDRMSAQLASRPATSSPMAREDSEQLASPATQSRRQSERMRTIFARRAQNSTSWIVGDVVVGKISGKIWRFLEAPDSSRAASVYYMAMSLAIILCTITSLFQARRSGFFKDEVDLTLDIFFNALFTVEFAVRFTISPTSCMFFECFFNLLDLAAILAGITRLVIGFAVSDTYYPPQAEVFIRLLPALQFMKLIRRFHLFHLLARAFREAFQVLPFLMYIMLLIVLIFGAAIDLAEPDSNIASLDQAMWFVLVTISTVGYGDYTAKSAIGRGLTCVLILVGTLYYAIPLGIVGNAFSHVWQTRHESLLQKKISGLLSLSGYTDRDVPLVFSLFDRRCACSLNLADFREMLEELNMHISSDESLTLFKALDESGKGSISERDFIRRVCPKAYERLYTDTCVYDGGPGLNPLPE